MRVSHFKNATDVIPVCDRTVEYHEITAGQKGKALLDDFRVCPPGLAIELIGHGPAYKLWGFVPMDLHFLRLSDQAMDQTFFLLGTDRLGRDVFSRVIHGARLSLSIGLVGVGLSFLLGILFGGLSGYYGGWVDTVVQRAIEFLRSIPRIPLWMALAAAVPPDPAAMWCCPALTDTRTLSMPSQ